MSKNNKNIVLKKLTDVCALQSDILLDLPVITIDGDSMVQCVNHKGILHYSGQIIRLGAKNKSIEITGNNLVIKTMDNRSIVIQGSIEGMKYIMTKG